MRRRATIIGCAAVVLWSLLALLTASTGDIPPFQLAAMTFALAGLAGVASWPMRPGARAALLQPPAAWAVGVGGLFGYHALYFAALRLAPPAEAGLVNYLWPLLVVLASAALPGERLKAGHVVGALLGLAGVLALVVGRASLEFRPGHVAGYACACAAAFVWASYSVLSRRFADVPTDAVTGFCLAAAALDLACHLAFERTVWPQAAHEWAALVALGLGPVGGAFYAWDVGMKRGEIKLLGIMSYAAPVLSTLFLVAAGYAEPSATLALACVLIVVGASLPALMRVRSIGIGRGASA